jgi:hypothetical protein
MKASITVSICLVAAGAGLAVFLNSRAPSMSSSAREVAETPPVTTLYERLDVTTSAVDEPRDTDVSTDQSIGSPSEEDLDDELARRQQGMADTIYQISGTWVVRRLTDLGLAQSDSESIARRYAADSAECAMATLKTEAARQSISVDELLSRAAAAARNGRDAFDAVDRSSLEANAFPCEVDALQRAGIPIDEEFERVPECVEQTAGDTNVSNVAAAIEICVQNGLADAARP